MGIYKMEMIYEIWSIWKMREREREGKKWGGKWFILIEFQLEWVLSSKIKRDSRNIQHNILYSICNILHVYLIMVHEDSWNFPEREKKSLHYLVSPAEPRLCREFDNFLSNTFAVLTPSASRTPVDVADIKLVLSLSISMNFTDNY